MRVIRIISVLVCFVLLAGACDGGRSIAWERHRTVLGPIPLKNRVAYVDSARDRVIVIDVSNKVPRLYSYAIGHDALYATPTPDRQGLAVITRGQEAKVKGQVAEDPKLWMVNVMDPASTPVAYRIGSPFDRLTISGNTSGDGPQVAVAYFSGSGPDAEGFFRNPNEIAVIDLTRGPADDNPILKTVRSFGSAPDGVVLSPPMSIPGAADTAPRVFAFILSLNNVTVVDTAHPGRDDVSIRLDSAGTDVRPRQLVFAPRTATAYLRSDNASDVLQIVLAAHAPTTGSPKENDYRPLLAELGAGGGPADFAVYNDAQGRRLILAATPSTGDVVIINADTGAFSKVKTPDPIDRVLLFPHGGNAVPQVAVLASLSARLPRVHLLSLDGIRDDLVAPQVRTVQLQKPVLDVVPVPGREMAMIVHDDSRTVLGLLDVAFGSVSPLQGVGRLDSYAFSPDGSYLIGATADVPRIGLLDLDDLHPTEFRLDDMPKQVFPMQNGVVFVDHGDPLGLATILPSPDAKRSDAVVLSGFLMNGILDGQP